MQSKLAAYRREGTLALRHMWHVILVFSIVQVIVSIAVAAANSNSIGGYKSASFAAIWAMFLAIVFAGVGAQIVFGGKSSELLVGFMIGIASMLAQLFFMLACIFFGLGTEATNLSYATAPADKAYGAFALVNTIIYTVWAIILAVHRNSVVLSKQEENASKGQYDANNNGAVYNPVSGGHPVGGSYTGDTAEL